MALSNSTRSTTWSRYHFIIRLIGLTGLPTAWVGALLAFLGGVNHFNKLRAAFAGELGSLARVGTIVAGVGLALAVLLLLIELMRMLFWTAGRRNAASINSSVQLVLCVALLVGVNVFSFRHFLRFDCTRDKLFTLPAEVQQQLRELQAKTTIVVYQKNQAFASFLQNRDPFDTAAERKIIDNIHDFVEQLRELGPKFAVVVLDINDNKFKSKYTELTKDNDSLKKAIDATQENSIIFYAQDAAHPQGKIQRLSFNALYQLDKVASQEANDKKGNLVLVHQNRGMDAFVRRVLNLDARRPKVALVSTRDWLSGRSDHLITSNRAMVTNLIGEGFDVVDIILQKETGEAAVYTWDESKFEQLQEELEEMKNGLKELNTSEIELKKVKEKLASADEETFIQGLVEIERMISGEPTPPTLKDAIKKTLKTRGEAFKEQIRKQRQKMLDEDLATFAADRKSILEEQENKTKERDALNVENLQELKRMSDLNAKLERLLADCDLILLPRYTIYQARPGGALPASYHKIDAAQYAALKQAVAKGKPVLGLFGPICDAGSTPFQPPSQSYVPDEIEQLFEKLGFEISKQVVLYRSEVKGLSDSPENEFKRSAIELPSIEFEWTPLPNLVTFTEKKKSAEKKDAVDNPSDAKKESNAKADDKKDPDAIENETQDADTTAELVRKPAHPIRASMKLVERSIGIPHDLKQNNFRPIFVKQETRDKLGYEPELMQSNEKSWNEDKPFGTRDSRPKPPKADASRGTATTKGKGPFPLGAALEVPVPADLRDSKEGTAPQVRVALLGHGGLFAGKDEISPVKRKLLVDTCNWLIGRDDLLTRIDPANPQQNLWQYPRLTHLSDNEKHVWQLGAWLGLPALFSYLGLVVILFRRLR